MGDEPRNWPEDYSHENGKYTCHCAICNSEFTGHKRRVICRVCWYRNPAVDALTAENAELRKLLQQCANIIYGSVAETEEIAALLDECRTALSQWKEGSDACPTVQTEDRRCNICGGLVHYDGTPPVKGCWPAKSRKEPCDAG